MCGSAEVERLSALVRTLKILLTLKRDLTSDPEWTLVS